MIWDEDSVDLKADAMIFLYNFPFFKSWPNEFVNNKEIEKIKETQYILTKSIKLFVKKKRLTDNKVKENRKKKY